MSSLGLAVAAVLAATPITLEEVREASRHQLDAVRAQLDVDRAGAAKTQAKSAILPQVNLSAGTSIFFGGPQRRFSTVPVEGANGQVTFEQRAVDTPGFVQGNFQLGVSVNQLIYDGSRWWNQISLAGAQEEAAVGQLKEQQLASELEAVRRFYELVRGQQTLKVLQATRERSQAQFERAKSLFEAGRVQKRDVLDAEVNVGNDRISVLRQEQALVTAQAELLSWLGRPSIEIEAVVPSGVTAPLTSSSVDQAATLTKAKQHRPLFKSLDSRIRAAQLQVEMARADYFPSVSAQAAYQRQGPTADPFFTDPTKQNSLSAGVNLNWNLFNGFATDSAVNRARSDVTQADLQQKQALAELESELRRLIKAVSAQEAIAEVAHGNLSLAKTQLQLEGDRYAAGAGSTIEVRNAELKLLSAELTVVQSRVDVEVARAALTRSVGADLEKP